MILLCSCFVPAWIQRLVSKWLILTGELWGGEVFRVTVAARSGISLEVENNFVAISETFLGEVGTRL